MNTFLEAALYQRRRSSRSIGQIDIPGRTVLPQEALLDRFLAMFDPGRNALCPYSIGISERAKKPV